MTDPAIRLLLLADTHLGFDLPTHPRVDRRRRGPDFFANTRLALEPARRGEVDLVVHGGDLLFRSRVSDRLVQQAMEPLLEVARLGVPVLLVPGNHERSRLPLSLWTVHPNLHIFRVPTTFAFDVHGLRVAIAGFPCSRLGRDQFGSLLTQTGYRDTPAELHLLSMHQTVEGATVGVQNYTFRSGPDVIPGRDIPADLAAVLSGHIHRAQVLRQDLAGRQLAAPVIYPGSVERTAFAERSETKGYYLLGFDPAPDGRGLLSTCRFVPLPTRPMTVLELDLAGQAPEQLSAAIRSRLTKLNPDSVVCLFMSTAPSLDQLPVLSASSLRALAPSTMDVSLRWPREMPRHLAIPEN